MSNSLTPGKTNSGGVRQAKNGCSRLKKEALDDLVTNDHVSIGSRRSFA
jgi:hypothetical protein